MSVENPEDFVYIPDRPPSLEESGFRRAIIPAPSKGKWTRRRKALYGILVFIFLVLPWTEFAGKQTILLHLGERKFTFFGNVFYAHDGPLLFFLLGLFVFALGVLTVLKGRVWCGWACPQTVFIDFIFRPIDRLVEGKYMQRRRLADAKWTLSKAGKRTLKWILFAIASSHIAHSFTAYFVGSSELLEISFGDPTANWTLFLWVQFVTLICLFDFGWFREQFCLIACPYGRFQSAAMNEKSMAVIYDIARGEPRRTKDNKKDHGDCVNCFKCVNVCPTGIDIRDGIQMECIHCTACMDACDSVMRATNRPEGLIRYGTAAEQLGKESSTTPRAFLLLVPLLILGALSFTFFKAVSKRADLDFKVLRAVSAQSGTGAKAAINMDHFKIHFTNQSQKTIEILSLETNAQAFKLICAELPLQIKASEQRWVHFFLQKQSVNFLQSASKEVKVNLKYQQDEDIENEEFSVRSLN